MSRRTSYQLALATLLSLAAFGADEPPSKETEPQETPSAKPEAKPDRRTELNLPGKTDTESGESRRNENVQFNPIDNNALKELNIRMGTTATIVEEFNPDRGYFGVEFGNRPPARCTSL